MTPIPVNLAVEDQLSEAVLRRILSHVDRDFIVGVAYNRGGYGYLRKTVKGWNNAAPGVPFVLLTDLDSRYPCPSALISDWLPGGLHPNLIFRVAIREVEAWLLGDPKNFARFLGVSRRRFPSEVENLEDPKATLIHLAMKSSIKMIRERIVPKSGSTAHQGRDYNGCLSEFVMESWDVDASCTRCPSLLRAVNRLRTFHPIWE